MTPKKFKTTLELSERHRLSTRCMVIESELELARAERFLAATVVTLFVAIHWDLNLWLVALTLPGLALGIVNCIRAARLVKDMKASLSSLYDELSELLEENEAGYPNPQ